MSQDILVPQQNGQLALPDYLQGSNFGVTENLLQGMFQGGNRIGLRNSRFRLIVGGVEEGIIQENYLDTIILAAAPAVSRVYYQGNFDPNDNQHLLLPFAYCGPGGADCNGSLTLTVPAANVACNFQIDAVLGPPLNNVGPNGSYYNSSSRQDHNKPWGTNAGGTNMLISANNGP